MRPAPIAAAVLAACVPPGDADTSAFLPDLPPPAIVSVEVACDPEPGRWTVKVGTDQWSGAAQLVWTKDGRYLERHTGFRSVQAAADGHGDLLEVDIGIVTDFRSGEDGATTFTCRDLPSAVVWVYDLAGRIADCAHGGPAPELLLGVEGLPACPDPWPGQGDPPGDGDGGDSDG